MNLLTSLLALVLTLSATVAADCHNGDRSCGSDWWIVECRDNKVENVDYCGKKSEQKAIRNSCPDANMP
ncbi:hypothetical protein HBH98_080800 [Parastagonospora nodorum]|nr:hypothetical protein HBH53_127630 [Parastagonospora nodorum]KAH3975052.1 hypothetical protein HBH51_087100 [Parastagonospora nodorum]KAH3978435.1 hypothetical protein HBH52_105650 [Parastagonospora nodorum]KAH4001315.1 hypothetical protein HBI10_087350 [Parastagonospora nodorum]KAH4027250.1 hypothetical protein HBI13_056370 [Parastagonospora nodorum]